MKIDKAIYTTPEINEEKLISLLREKLPLTKRALRNRLKQLYPDKDIINSILDEYNLIQQKTSLLTKSQRDQIIGFVGLCMIEMVKGNGKENK